MGIVVDFAASVGAMLDELQETYDGRILSPQGKIIRVMPIARNVHNGNGTWKTYGQVYVTTVLDGKIFQARLETDAVKGTAVSEEGRRKVEEALESLTRVVEELIRSRGFIIRRGRYVFKGERPHQEEQAYAGAYNA